MENWHWLAPIGAVVLFGCATSNSERARGIQDNDVTRSGVISGAPAAPPPAEKLATSFVFVGGCRMAPADWDPATNPSSANIAELNQTLTDIAALPQRPKYFFFTGDLVTGMAPGTSDLQGQLDAWAQYFTGHPSGVASAVPLIAIAGNHEVLQKIHKVELPNPAADAVWSRWLTAKGFDRLAGNGPTAAPPNADALQGDQSRMSYSFDAGNVHYVVLNTDTSTTTPDPVTGSTQLGWIALHWLTADLDAAQANPAIGHIFVFGHKPLVAPSGKTSSDEAINPALAANFAQALDSHGKVDAYLCSHAHLWDVLTLPGARHVPQVVAGNGGSPVDADWRVANPYFGFSEARVYDSGRVAVVSHERPAPDPYDADPGKAAVPQAELTLVRAH